MIKLIVRKQLSRFIIAALFGISPLQAQSLTEIYQLALLNDPVIRQAEAKQSATMESRNQSLALFFPVISASASSTRLSQTNTKLNVIAVPQQDYWNNIISINLTQPVFHWDYWIQLSQSDNQIAEAQASYQSELQNLMMRTAEAYFNVLSAQDNLSYAVAVKQAIAKQLEQAKQRFEVGIIAITDVNEAQAGFDNAFAEEIRAANLLNNEKEVLREIIGDREIELDSLGARLPLKAPEPTDIEAWSKTAIANNFNIIAALNRAEAARKDIDLQLNGHLPTLDLVAAYQETDNTNRFGSRGDTQSIGLQLNIPIFEGGAVNSKTRQAQFEYKAAKENLIAVQRSINRQIKDAYRGVMTSISQVKALSAALISAESALEASEAGFEVGTRTMVDVLLGQRNLFMTKRDLSRVRYDYLINSIKLKQLSSNLSQDDIDRISSLLLALGKPDDQLTSLQQGKP